MLQKSLQKRMCCRNIDDGFYHNVCNIACVVENLLPTANAGGGGRSNVGRQWLDGELGLYGRTPCRTRPARGHRARMLLASSTCLPAASAGGGGPSSTGDGELGRSTRGDCSRGSRFRNRPVVVMGEIVTRPVAKHKLCNRLLLSRPFKIRSGGHEGGGRARRYRSVDAKRFRKIFF